MPQALLLSKIKTSIRYSTFIRIKYDFCSLFQGRKFANQQMDMYDWAGDLLSNTLGMDGKACVQRLICELAEVPVNDRSFMGEILHRIVE